MTRTVYGRVPYADRLAEAGVALTPARMADLVRDTARRLFPCRTDEEILLRPSECAVPLCAALRQALRLPDLAEDLILRHLTRPRKWKES
jgi:hypothetical protein